MLTALHQDHVGKTHSQFLPFSPKLRLEDLFNNDCMKYHPWFYLLQSLHKINKIFSIIIPTITKENNCLLLLVHIRIIGSPINFNCLSFQFQTRRITGSPYCNSPLYLPSSLVFLKQELLYCQTEPQIKNHH